MTKGQEEMDQDDELTEEDEFIDGDSEEVEEIDGPEVGSQASYHETSRAVCRMQTSCPNPR